MPMMPARLMHAGTAIIRGMVGSAFVRIMKFTMGDVVDHCDGDPEAVLAHHSRQA